MNSLIVKFKNKKHFIKHFEAIMSHSLNLNYETLHSIAENLYERLEIVGKGIFKDWASWKAFVDGELKNVRNYGLVQNKFPADIEKLV